jgi:hypothetical protein
MNIHSVSRWLTISPSEEGESVNRGCVTSGEAVVRADHAQAAKAAVDVPDALDDFQRTSQRPEQLEDEAAGEHGDAGERKLKRHLIHTGVGR